MNPILEFRNVTKKYGSKLALNQVSLQIQPGKIVGLLGSNGSGKSTMMKLASGLAYPTSGEVLIDNKQAGLSTKSIISFMADAPIIDGWMKVSDAIAFTKDFHTDFDEVKAMDMLRFMNINETDKVDALSKGMKERLHLALTLSRNSKLYLLDEPIGGVDPVARGKILDAIVEYYNTDSSIVVTTHLIQDIERIFDDVIMIKNGQIMLHDEVENIRMQQGKSIDELFKEVYAEC